MENNLFFLESGCLDALYFDEELAVHNIYKGETINFINFLTGFDLEN